MDRERRKDKLVFMGIPEEEEDGSVNSTVGKVIKSLIPVSEIGYVVTGRIERRKDNIVRPPRVQFGSPIERRKLLRRR